ncbi:hypothetical protein SteCoe_714 [Stentor coeruleus]|uniref:Uncharacterized protein n=1 Tax=Stentor coeruleus TaxID=5963 RepID=A0A1R2D3I3_9CILI|nr:hypothetical protein SteCoe_714 [Stentor coeruleus]
MKPFKLSARQSIEERISILNKAAESLKSSRNMCLEKIHQREKENLVLSSTKSELLAKLQSLKNVNNQDKTKKTTLFDLAHTKRKLRKKAHEKKEELQAKKKWENLKIPEENVVNKTPSLESGKNNESNISVDECDCEVQKILANSQLSTARSKNVSLRNTPICFKSHSVIKFHILPLIL